MAFTILAQVGAENPNKVLATTIVSYSLSSIMTGVAFYIMGYCKIGYLIGFFPRHILTGCIGGVGWFLVVTGLEVSAGLEGGLTPIFETLKHLFRSTTIALWTAPLLLALTLLTLKRWINHQYLEPIYFISITAIFHFLVAVIPGTSLSDSRSSGWLFEPPPGNVPWYHFWQLFGKLVKRSRLLDHISSLVLVFKLVEWKAVASTIPAMLALTFFGVLHVPINIPALAMSTGEDNVDLDRELRAHGISNAVSGGCGSIQVL